MPRKATFSAKRLSGAEASPDKYLIEVSPQDPPQGLRSLELLYARIGGASHSAVHSELSPMQDRWKLTVSRGDRVFQLILPPLDRGAGEISISTLGGKALLDIRPFPSGMLPHGLEGNRLLERWDADYHGKEPPAWDIGRAADELRKVVREGTVRACRVVDLGCGSGTDAIFLASQGFDVTAIDISPTALHQAKEKALKAGVSVTWLLADVLDPPSIGRFDFIYDRGCYHNVRDQDLPLTWPRFAGSRIPERNFFCCPRGVKIGRRRDLPG